jgi:hypothetical protein
LWEKLSAGGEKQKCGWLKDKYGLSWQIIPTVLGTLLQDQDAEKANRVMKAMLEMDKIDITRLREAYDRGSPWPLASERARCERRSLGCEERG